MKYLIRPMMACQEISTEIAIYFGCGLCKDDVTYQYFSILNHPTDNTIGALIIPDGYEYVLEDHEILELKTEDEMRNLLFTIE